MLRVMIATGLLSERHLTKKERVSRARDALSTVFGKNRVRIHVGSCDRITGEDTTHWLYISIRLRKDDKRNQKRYTQFRREVINILKHAGVQLYETQFTNLDNDKHAISLNVE